MKTCFTLFFLFVSSLLIAQTSFKTAINTSQGQSIDVFDLVQLNDGSYAGVGTSDDNGILVVKLNAQGSLVSSTVISSTSDFDEGVSIIKTSDGGFAVGGSLGDAMAILRFNSGLTLQWQKQYAASDAGSTGARLIQTSDGGFMIAGYVYDDDGNTAGYLVKTDSQGNVSFSKQYGGFADNVILDVVAVNEGNYALLQTSGDIDDETPDSSALIKIKPDGSIIWTSHINTGDYGQFPISLLYTSDNSLVVSGIVEQPYTIFGQTESTLQMMMAKFSSSGSLLWAKNTTSAGSNFSFSIGYGVTEDKDGGYIFTGELARASDDFETDTTSAYLVKLSSAGNLVWTKTITNSTDEDDAIFYSVIKTSDGGFAVAGSGYQDADNTFSYSGTVYKFSSSGDICGGTGSSGTVVNLGTGGLSANISSASLTTTVNSATVTTSSVGTGVNICSVLPLQLLSFKAALQNKSVNIEWKTANEVNTGSFTVERSSNGTSFTALQTLPAKGNSSNVQTYTTNDWKPLFGTSYYRLKQVDKDGSFTYSNIVPVTVSANGTIVISPNPVQSNIRVLLQSAANAQTTFRVVDMTGKTLAVQVASVNAGTNTILIPAASLSRGLYVLKVMQSGSIRSIKFMKD